VATETVVGDRVVVLWSSVLLSFNTTSHNKSWLCECGNLALCARFPKPCGNRFMVSMGCHLHSHLWHRPRSSRSWGDAVPWAACRSSFLEAPTRSFWIRTGSASVPRPRGHVRHMVLLRGLVGAQVGLDLGAPAPRSAFEDVRVMEQPIEERGDGGRVAQQLPPVVHWSV
jgi:hypothetical protein